MMHFSPEYVRGTNLKPLRDEVERYIGELRKRNDEKGRDATDTAFLRGEIAACNELLTAFTRVVTMTPGRPQRPDLSE